jgi:hypothetical protein
VRMHMSKRKKCSECIDLCIDDCAPVATFSKHKDFTDCSLVNTSLPLSDIATRSLKSTIHAALFSDHPQQYIISSFLANVSLENTNFSCSIHESDFLHLFLTSYCNIRLFHAIRMCNANIKGAKKGCELSKQKKINI